MLLRIDPQLSLVWRTPHELQIGAPEAVARVQVTDDWELRLIERLRLGVSRQELAELAEHSPLPNAHRRLELLLASVERSLLGRRRVPTPPLDIAVLGDDRIAARIHRTLCSVGLNPIADPATAQLTVLAAHFVVDPNRYRPLLNQDRAHLAVLFDDTTVRITPVIVPGRTGCLYCAECTRCERDPQWPAIASQLLRRRAAAAGGPLLAAAAIETAFAIERYLAEPPTEPRLTLLSRDGRRFSQPWQAHPLCDCCWPAAQPENVTAIVHREHSTAPNSPVVRRAHG